MTNVATTTPSTRATELGPYIIKIPANIWLGIERIECPNDGEVGYQLMHDAVGGRLEHLHLLSSDFNMRCMEAGYDVDAFGLHDGRVARVVPANLRATSLLGWPRTVSECIVGDVILCQHDGQGGTIPLPPDVWSWFVDEISDPIPGLI